MKKMSSFKWFGSQYGNLDLIQPFMTPAHNVFIDCFCGSGVLTLNHPNRPPSSLMVDMDDRVTTTFSAIRNDVESLALALWATPWSQKEYASAIAPLDGTESEMEVARRFLFACTASVRGGSYFGPRDFRIRKMSQPVQTEMDSLIRKIYGIAGRLRNVQIINDDALQFLTKGSTKVGRIIDNPNSLIAADPPWMAISTKGYKAGSHSSLHDDLFDILNASAGYVFVLGVQTDEYAQTYEATGWKRFDKTYRMNSAATGSMSLWANPKLADAYLSQISYLPFDESVNIRDDVARIAGQIMSHEQ